MPNPIGNDNFSDAMVALLSPIIQVAADYAGTISLPFARYVDLGDSYTYFTKSAGDPVQRQVINDTQFQISIYTVNREQARQIGRQIMDVLDDYKTSYQDGRIMALEPISAVFMPEPRSGPSTPTVFHRAIIFSLTEQRSI